MGWWDTDLDGGLEGPPCQPADSSGWMWAYWTTLKVRDGSAEEALGWWAVVADTRQTWEALEERWLRAAARSPTRWSPRELLLWPDLGVPAASPHPEEGSRGLWQALSRRDAACPSLPLVSITGMLPWCGQASPSLPPSKHFFFFPSGEDKAGNSLRAPRRGGFEQDNPFGQASNTSV